MIGFIAPLPRPPRPERHALSPAAHPPTPLEPIPLGSIEAARDRLVGIAAQTPLIPWPEPSTGRGGIWLKLECLQPIGSFKIRGAANAIGAADPDALAKGVYTVSAGNMAQGVAMAAKIRGLPCRVVVPEHAPLAKVDAIGRLGAATVAVPYDVWWDALVNHGLDGEEGFFVHPVSHPDVVAGNGTIGLEIVDRLPDVDTVVVPFGGGGLSTGIASALAATAPGARVVASEVETAAPLFASLAAGAPRSIDRIPTFVDGIGGSGMLEEMWPLVSTLVTESTVVSVDEICQAIRRLATHAKVVAEGAGASALAAAFHRDPDERVVAVISGGNLDTEVFRTILSGGCPDTQGARG